LKISGHVSCREKNKKELQSCGLIKGQLELLFLADHQVAMKQLEIQCLETDAEPPPAAH
jgi:hypothetical protein